MTSSPNYLAEARRSVALRLARSLTEENLTATPIDASAIAAMEQIGPAHWLRAFALDGNLTEPVPNLERACREIEDGIIGLARARNGLAKRWAGATVPAETDSSPRFGALVAALRSRNAALGQPADSTSALVARFEQLVGEGHPAHPAAKTSLGLGQDWSRVLPEQVETIECRFVAVRADAVEQTGQPINQALAAQLPGLWERLHAECVARDIDDGYCVVPVHPWQLERVVRTRFADEIDRGEIQVLHTRATAEPLMSVRTVRISDETGSAHLKLALEAQLTGAIRGISRGATTGPLLSRAIGEVLRLDASLSPRTADDAPAFHVCEDLAGVRFSAADGTQESAQRGHVLGAVLRRDPVATLGESVGAQDVVLPAAALQAPNPLTGNRILADIFADIAERTGQSDGIVEAWFMALANVLAVPAISLAARWGIALEPHPQNTLLVLRHGVPVGAIVRDFGGARALGNGPLWQIPAVQDSGLRDHLHGTALYCEDPDALVDKLTYPLIDNLWRGLDEAAGPTHGDAVWRGLATACDAERRRSPYTRSAAAEPEAVELGKHVWERVCAADLPHKRLLAMRFSGAVTDQAYVRVANPIHRVLVADQACDGAVMAEDVERAKWDVDTRWRASCRMEGVDPECIDEDCVSGDCAPEHVRRDKQQASLTLATARNAVRRRLRALRAQAMLRSSNPEQAHRVATGEPSSFWEMVALAPRGLRNTLVDSLAVEGHSVHPLAKLRRGFSESEAEAFSSEGGHAVELRLVAVEKTLLRHSAVGSFSSNLNSTCPAQVAAAYAELATADRESARHKELILVHPWQWEHVLLPQFAAEIERGSIRLIRCCTVAAYPTISLRTLVPVAPGPDGSRPFIKTALDVVLTSTRRSISQDSALGTPEVARLIDALVRRVADTDRIRVVVESSGVAYAGAETVERARGLSTLMRDDALRDLPPDEVCCSACTLRAQPPGEVAPLAGVIASYADHPDPAAAFVAEYARDLLSVVLPLMWRYGVALESHLQNTMVRLRHRSGVVEYRGLVLRDFSGLRILTARMRQAGFDVPTQPGAVTATSNYREFLDKGYYANVFANLSGLIDAVIDAAPDATRTQLWAVVRTVVDEVVNALGTEDIPAGDVEHLLAPALHQKAFVTMALHPEGGDHYVDVPNPLCG